MLFLPSNQFAPIIGKFHIEARDRLYEEVQEQFARQTRAYLAGALWQYSFPRPVSQKRLIEWAVC